MALDYVVKTGCVRCTFGTQEAKLKLPMDHGVFYGKKKLPLMNMMDHKPFMNIPKFGQCAAPLNPGNIPIVKMCPCMPMTPAPWVNAKLNHILDGFPILTDSSIVICFFGGVISVTKAKG